MRIESDSSGLDILYTRVHRLTEEFPWLTRDIAERAGKAVERLISDSAPRSHGTGLAPPGDAQGALADSFKVEVSRQGNALWVNILTSQPTKLGYVTKGTGIYGPHRQRIVPREKRALFWPGAAHPYRSVKGQKPNKFMERIRSQMNEIVRREMENGIRKLNEMVGGD